MNMSINRSMNNIVLALEAVFTLPKLYVYMYVYVFMCMHKYKPIYICVCIYIERESILIFTKQYLSALI